MGAEKKERERKRKEKGVGCLGILYLRAQKPERWSLTAQLALWVLVYVHVSHYIKTNSNHSAIQLIWDRLGQCHVPLKKRKKKKKDNIYIFST